MSNERRIQLSRIMRRGHKLAKKMQGDYRVRLSLALQLAWKEEKEMDKEIDFNHFFSRDVNWTDALKKSILEERNSKKKKDIQDIIQKLKNWKSCHNKRAHFSFGNQETWDMWDVVEGGSGLSIRDADEGFVTYINREEFRQLKELHSKLEEFDYED